MGLRPVSESAPEVLALYDKLGSLSISEERAVLRTLSTSVKVALWTHHLHVYIKDHLDLSDTQTAVISDGLRLIASPGWFDPSSPGWSNRLEALESHKNAAAAVFSESALYAIFHTLAGERRGTPRHPTEGHQWGFS
jgi:hypothetical protein